MTGAVGFVDAGSVFRYTGPTSFAGQPILVADKNIVRSSVGVGLTWASPFGALTACGMASYSYSPGMPTMTPWIRVPAVMSKPPSLA